MPDSLIIIGGGVIGTEFATLFSMLGKKVTVLEMMPEILPGVDGEIVKLLRRTMKKRGITVVTNARVTGIGENGQVTVDFELDEAECSVSADCCVLAVGRRPQTAGIGLDRKSVV